MSRLRSSALAFEPETSTCTEWSITKSTGTCGFTFSGSPPISTIASRSAARSTTAGTPVKSCKMTRDGRNGISPLSPFAVQVAIFFTSFSVIRKPSQFLNAPSRSTLTEYGREEVSMPDSSIESRE